MPTVDDFITKINKLENNDKNLTLLSEVIKADTVKKESGNKKFISARL